MLLLLTLLSLAPEGHELSPLQASIRIYFAPSVDSVASLYEGAYLDASGKLLHRSSRDTSGSVTFHFLPDPAQSYSFWVGSTQILRSRCFVPGDSVVFFYSGNGPATIEFDRLGANRFESDRDHSSALPEYGRFLDDTTCSGFSNFLKAARNLESHWHKAAATARSRFPHHNFLSQLYAQRAALTYRLAAAQYLSQHGGALKRAGCLGLSARDVNSLADSLIDLGARTNVKLVDPSNLVVLSDALMSISAYRSAAPSSDTELFARFFEQALKWRGIFRDVALYQTVRRANLSLPVITSKALAERALDSLKKFGADAGVISSLQYKLDQILQRSPGALAENFTLPDTAGNLHSLSDYLGKAVLLHVWGTWCGPCIADLPAVTHFIDSMKSDTNFVCISIALEDPDRFEHWRSFVDSRNLRGPQLFYSNNGTNTERPYGLQWVEWVPAYIVIDRSGHLVSAEEYPPPNDQLLRTIEAAKR